ncbi:lipoprotein [Rhizobium sp. XQZ8]|uniref:LPS translocon maturation chaperone LptM n=1 Tax=Rhizobium populisoli TaxID=2859785 RepID=UPI001C667A54|nr:lipoprotein [Rhizobium populisoli]MBW6423832.1 lipoprotein [Rhizobium populisoli]
MSNSLVKIARITFALTLGCAVVVGCGRKGDLDRPSTPLEQQNIRKNVKPGERKAEPVAEKPFLLDPLL